MGAQGFTIGGRVRSFGFAFRGLRLMLVSQHNAWLHAAATVGVVGTGLAVRLSGVEWCLLVLAVMAVWTAEAMNTALEFLCDVASPDFHPLVEKSKDVAAGAVLLSAMGAAVIGLIVIVPKLVAMAG